MDPHAALPPFVTRSERSFHFGIDASRLASAMPSVDLTTARGRDRIVGPYDYYVFDAIRARERVRTEESVASDYFLWGAGEAPHRAMTKIGGVPYLPASVEWPCRDGVVGEFFAQLNFADSTDLVPALPGDVLLVFRYEDDDCTSWDEELYEFVWVALTDGMSLVRPEDQRRSRVSAGSEWPALHGYRVRSYDDASVLEQRLGDDAFDSRLVNGIATKIGGIASDMQSVHTPDVPDDYRFLGQVAAVWPVIDHPYPVVTRAAPVADYPHADYQALMSGPGDGVLCLYLDGEDAVRIYFSGA